MAVKKTADLTYEEALHAMQSGVAHTQQLDLQEGRPDTTKHLRVGINSAHVTDRALAELLIAKGIITTEEYIEAVRVAMCKEVAEMEEQLSARFGGTSKITLR